MREIVETNVVDTPKEGSDKILNSLTDGNCSCGWTDDWPKIPRHTIQVVVPSTA